MFFFLSKLLPVFIYPVGLSILLIIVAYRLNDEPATRSMALTAAVLVLVLSGNKWGITGSGTDSGIAASFIDDLA